MDLLATLFIEPIHISGLSRLMMMLPLSLAVAIVYKTLKLQDLKQAPLGVVALWVTMVAGMLLVGVVLLIAYELAR